MKIVVLDGYTLSPGDLRWDRLKALGECWIYDRSTRDEAIIRAQDAEVLLTNKACVDEEVLRAANALRYIGVLATGYNNVDVEAAAARGIPVSNVPSYGTASVAQLTFALLLELTQHVGHHAETVRRGKWSECPDFCYWDFPLVELEGLTLGIIGLGRIGRAVARLGDAFGMRLMAYTRHPPQSGWDFVSFVDFDTLLAESDVVSLHCPLTEATRGLIDRNRIGQMKSSAFLLNTSRGALVNEEALAEALDAGRLAGAGVDVLNEEPPRNGSPLFKAKNCYITPHLGWGTRAARERLMQAVIENIEAFLQGRPQNVVN